MTMSETNSNHNDWVQFYQRTLAAQQQQPLGSGSGGGNSGGATIITNTATATSSTVAAGGGATTTGGGGGTTHSNIEGRVGKAARRRSRASRKAPTTLLNTDTTNFRAMVQQFTGVPSAPFHAGPSAAAGVFPGGTAATAGLTTLNFGLHNHQQYLHPHQQLYPQQQYLQQHHDGGPIFTLGNTITTTTAGGGGDLFLHGFGNPVSSRGGNNMEVPEGFLMENISASSSSQMMSRPAASTDSRTGDGFLL